MENMNRDKLFFDILTKDIKSNITLEPYFEYLKYNRILTPILFKYKSARYNNINYDSLSKVINLKVIELIEIIKSLHEKEIEYLLIKSVVYRKYYNQEVIRQNRDFDFIVKDFDNFVEFYKLLLTRGFEFDHIPMFGYQDKEITGIVGFKKNIDKNTEIKIEINIKNFFVNDKKGFDLFLEDKSLLLYNDLSISVPSDNINLLILITEISSRHTFMLRDLIDFHYIFINGNVDEKKFLMKLDNEYLINVYKKIKDLYYSLLNNEYIDKTNNVKKYKAKEFIKEPIKDKIDVLYNFFYNSFKELTKYDFLWNVIKKVDYIIPPKTRFQKGFITHFILLNNKEYSIKWVSINGLDILETSIGQLLPTNYGIIDARTEKVLRDIESLKHN
jgi:hypothetical protein